MSFDITIAFDDTEYLNPQLYMFADTLKDNIPDDTILHITTTRDENDPVIKYIYKHIHTKIYKKEPFDDLMSRCQYLLRAAEIETSADYVIRMDVDMIALDHLKGFNDITKLGYDIMIQGENRRIIKNDILEKRIWRKMYRAMNIEMPQWNGFHYVENSEKGLPLLNTGMIVIKSDLLETIKNRWHKLTKICERWIDYGIHPNEFAFTALIVDERWNWGSLDIIHNFNPISYFRKGEFPSTDLIEDCKIPEEVIMLHYHRPKWLIHLAKYNENVKEIVNRNREFIPEDWWDLTNKDFVEK